MAKDTSSKVTIDHDTIRKWIEDREGTPARVKTDKTSDVGIIRIDFPYRESPNLEPITWDQFFTEFDKKNLAFLYQDFMKNGEMSRFFKFVSRDSVKTQL